MTSELSKCYWKWQVRRSPLHHPPPAKYLDQIPRSASPLGHWLLITVTKITTIVRSIDWVWYYYKPLPQRDVKFNITLWQYHYHHKYLVPGLQRTGSAWQYKSQYNINSKLTAGIKKMLNKWVFRWRLKVAIHVIVEREFQMVGPETQNALSPELSPGSGYNEVGDVGRTRQITADYGSIIIKQASKLVLLASKQCTMIIIKYKIL